MKRERALRLSEDIQKQYEAAERSNEEDWLGVTLALQQQCLREAGIEPHMMREFTTALQTVHSTFPRLSEESIQVKYNRARKGNLIAGMPAPNVVMTPLDNPSAPLSLLDLQGDDGKALLLVAGSYS